MNIILNQEITLICGIPILAVLLVIMALKKRSLSYLFFFSAFWLYLLVVAAATFFPLPIDTDRFAQPFNMELFLRRINPIPFYFGRFATARSIFYALSLNIILTIPFGFLVRFIVRFKDWDALWLGPVVGLSIESTQLLLNLLTANPYRVIDANDVIANAVGVWVGFAAFRIFAWVYQAVTRWLKLRPRGVFGYVYEVTQV